MLSETKSYRPQVSPKSLKAGKGALTVNLAKTPSAEKIRKYQVRWRVKGEKSWYAAK